MALSNKYKRLSVITILTFMLLMQGSFASARMSQQQIEDTDAQISKQLHYYSFDSDLIVVFYDEHDSLMNDTALSLVNSIGLMTPNIVGFPVNSLEDIETVLEYTSYMVAIYVFQSDTEGLFIHKRIGDSNIKQFGWRAFAETLNTAGRTKHILAMGNTMQLHKYLDGGLQSNVYISQDEQVDAQHMFIYALWTLADILEAETGKKALLGEDIRMASLQYFADNFNQLAAANIEPANPMGVMSAETLQATTDRYMAEHPATIERIPREGLIADQEKFRDVDPVTGEVVTNGYGFDFFPVTESAASEFILQLLPAESGLRGPIGGIIDVLLGYLFDEIGGAIGLDSDTVESIVDVLFTIPDFIGAVANPDASKIKSFIDKLKPMLPIPQDAYKYIDLAIDALFAFRGDGESMFTSITDLVVSAIDLIVPDMSIGGFKLTDLLRQVLNLGDGILERIQEGGNAVDIILSVLNENILLNLTQAFIGNGSLFGIAVSAVPGMVEKLGSFVSMITNMVSSFDIRSLIDKYGPTLLTSVFSMFGLTEQYSKLLMTGLGMVLTGAGVFQTATLDKLLAELLSYVTGTDVDDLLAKAKEVIQIVAGAVDQGISSVDDFKTSLNTILNTLGLDSNLVTGIDELFLIIAKLKNEGLNIGNSVNVGSAITNLLEGLGVVNSTHTEIIVKVMESIVGLVAFIKDPPSLKSVIGNFFKDTKTLNTLMTGIIKAIMELVGGDIFESAEEVAAIKAMQLQGVTLDQVSLDALDRNQTAAAIGEGIAMVMQIISGTGNPTQGILVTLLNAGGLILSQLTGTDIAPFVETIKLLFGQFLGLRDNMPTMKELTDLIIPMLPASVQSGVKTLLEVLVTLQDIFTNGLGAIFTKLAEWVTGQVMELLQGLMGSLGAILGGDAIELLALSIPIGIGGFSLFNIELALGLKLGIEFDVDALIKLVMDLIFKGISMFSPETSGAALTAGDVLRKALTFFSITPIFVASFELSDFGGSPGFLDFMVASLGLELKISGSGFFELMLFSFKNGSFNWDDFFKVIAWGFKFSITISRMFTLLDFLTGGAGGSLNSIGKYIGLDAISITIYFTIAFEIIKRAATAIAPETGTMTISLIIGFTVSLGIDLFIAHLILTGTLELTLTLLQDLVSPAPLRIFIAIQLIITVSIGFLFWDWDFKFKWSPDGFEPPLGYELTPSTPADAVTAGALGGDSDGDGLSDKYEDATPGLDKNNPDSDDDGLNDKFETQTLKSDPASADTDGDGLDDLREYELKTDLLNPDTDFDGLNDYEEVVIYGTNPFSQDTDGDGLSDHYEINHAWNVTGVTQSVFGIMIGGVPFDDRTDPLNPDTDGDGLIDGEEGPRGIYYGPHLYNTNEHDGYVPDPPLFFNGGYTHPLDNDTDDDSYWQLYDGSKAPMSADRLFLMDMSDYREIKGYSIIFIDVLTGEPEPARIVRTNPTNPDSDGDTGVTEQQRLDPPFGFFLNSDGYELSRDPPTDPLDGDTDDDGLIDGLEGMLRPDSNHTWGLNPDTDGDGLGDLQEVQLGTDGRSIDTDLDGVTDGDEFFRYGTNPFLYDTDGDGLSDSEELFYYHSNPLQQDSDGDGLSDYEEVWIYFSDPMDEDSDNDGLTDWEEIWIYYTDPYNEDTDGDLLLDGEEVAGLEYSWTNKTTQETFYYLIMTDPLKWDTDNDSIVWLDQYGEMSQSMSDYEEWLLGTDPTRSDSDLDGISDGWEVYLGTDKIPWLDPIKLDPLSKDTDGDKLNDGAELIVVNQSTLLHPFVGFTLLMPFNTSAVLNDTDGDLIDDWTEISVLGSRPDMVDTDNDTLTDYAEWKIYLTDPLKNDTDGDGLFDQHEIFGYDYSIYNNDSRIWYDNKTSLVSGFFLTGANNSDSDGDLLPDGAEIWLYTSDPTNAHEHDPDILDGMLIDSDFDGLYDGEEYYIYGTVASPEGGGPFEVDSDRDGLFDGLEVYVTNSDPSDWDTDDDTYSDGLEWYCGTGLQDNTTTAEEIRACFAGLVRIAVLSPVSKTYTSNSIPIVVFDSTSDMTDMTYKWKQIANETWHEFDGNWSDSVIMNKDLVRGDGYWSGLYIDLPYKNGTYQLEVTASNATNTYTRVVTFSIKALGGDVVIIRPEPGQYSFIEFATPRLPIEVKVAPGVNQVKFRIKFGNGTIYQDNTTLLYEPGLQSFFLDEQEFPAIPGYTDYAIEVFANNTKGQEVVASVLITIKTPTVIEDILIITGGGASLGLIGFIGRKAIRGGFKNPFKKNT